ncbi:MAG: hypothetical protein ACREFO_10365 [Acetobacteraceae bacterium]
MNSGRALPWPGRAEGAAKASGSRLTLAACFMIATISPLLWIRVPALVDYPDHLARMWILAAHGSIPALAANYQLHWRILPDLAMDLIVPPLSHLLPIEIAGRVFIALTMMTLIGGTATLHRVLYGRWAIWPLWSALFVYNAVLFWGFLNCLFGIGVSLFALSGWMATREWRPAWRVLPFSAAATLLFILHLFAFGFYGLAVALYELDSRISQRRISIASAWSLLAAGAQFLPGFVLWDLSLKHVGPTVTVYGNLADKLHALLAPFTFGYVPAPFDLIVGLLAVAFLVWAIFTRSLTLAREFRRPLAVMAIVAIAMPNVLSGSWAADLRLPVALTFLLIAGAHLRMPSPRMAAAFASIAFCVLGARIWTVTQTWRDYDRQFAEFRSASRVITPGSRLLIVEGATPATDTRLPGVPRFFAVRQSVAYFHMPELAIIDRSAFIPYVFTGWTTIEVAPRNRDIAESVGSPATPEELQRGADSGQLLSLDTRRNMFGERPYWWEWPESFDFALWIDFGTPPKNPPPHLRPLVTGSFFDIFRIERPVVRAR